MTSGCVITKELAKDKIHIETDPMKFGRDRMQNGDYNGALKEYNKILKAHPTKSPGDKALFELGILFAYPDNPKRSSSKASGYFKRLLKEFPESLLKRESLAWVDTLDKIHEYEEKIKALSERNRAYKEKVTTLEKNNRAYIEKVTTLEKNNSACEGQIKALKEIDIGLEEKKRQEEPE
jgi:hypothetical protein